MTSPYKDRPWLKSYPEWLPADLPLPNRTIVDCFHNHSSHNSQKACLYYFNEKYSYADIHYMANALSSYLNQKKIGQGDRVICYMQNIPQMVISCIAVWQVSGIVVPLNPMYKTKELEYFISDSEPSVIICQEDLYEQVLSSISDQISNINIITTSPIDFLSSASECPKQLANVTKSKHTETYDFWDLISDFAGAHVQYSLPNTDDLAYLVYTSGTTGPPKGAMISHLNMIFNCSVYEHACNLNSSDSILGVAPLFHVTGIVAHMAVAIYIGIPFVLFHRFEVKDALQLIENHQISFTVAPITIYIAMINNSEIQNFDLSSFKKAYSGGAPVSPSIVEKFYSTTGSYIYNVYGLTESTSPATITPLGLQAPVDNQSGALSVGLPVPGHEAYIVDYDNYTQEVDFGQEGELVLRGPGITQGYWKKPEETDNAIKNRCFYTGDVAKIDANGWCYIVDRKKDLINVSGFKVWPREVEDTLYQHEAVKEAAVVGVPDAYRGENVKAFVSLQPGYENYITSDDLIEFCKSELAAYKYPRILEIIDDIPKTSTGKFLRRELKNW